VIPFLGLLHPTSTQNGFPLQTGKERFADLATLEAANTLNEALCERYAQHCLLDDGSVHPTVQRECRKTFELAEEIRVAYVALGTVPQNSTNSLCQDKEKDCESRAQEGKCLSEAGDPTF
jgi:hypothetical protein